MNSGNAHYYLLRYSQSINLGDQIQSLAAKQFLPQVDGYVDRDEPKGAEVLPSGKIIANGWYLHSGRSWPLPANLRPLFVSMHIDPSRYSFFREQAICDYLKSQEPIGTRDHATRDFLRSIGIEAYFTGCLTLTLPTPKVEKTERVLLVDCPIGFRDLLPTKLRTHAVSISNESSRLKRTIQRRFESVRRKCFPPSISEKAEAKFESKLLEEGSQLLETYASSRLVITSRLHCALPCLAMNVPVVFLTPLKSDTRFGGLLDLLWHVDRENFAEEMRRHNWVPNYDDVASHLEIREDLIRRCKLFIENQDKLLV